MLGHVHFSAKKLDLQSDRCFSDPDDTEDTGEYQRGLVALRDR